MSQGKVDTTKDFLRSIFLSSCSRFVIGERHGQRPNDVIWVYATLSTQPEPRPSVLQSLTTRRLHSLALAGHLIGQTLPIAYASTIPKYAARRTKPASAHRSPECTARVSRVPHYLRHPNTMERFYNRVQRVSLLLLQCGQALDRSPDAALLDAIGWLVRRRLFPINKTPRKYRASVAVD